MACSRAAQKGRGKTGELTAGGEPGQPVPAPTVSPFGGGPRLSEPHGVPGGRRQTKRRWPTRTKKGNHKANRPLKEAVWASFEGRFPVVCRGDLCDSPIPRGTGCPLPAGGLPRCHARRVWKPCAAGGARLHGRGPEGGGRRETPAPWAAAPGTRECGAARIRRMGSGEHGLHLMLRGRGVRGDEAAFDGLSVHGQGQAALLVAREVANVDAVEAAPEAAGHRYLA